MCTTGVRHRNSIAFDGALRSSCCSGFRFSTLSISSLDRDRSRQSSVCVIENHDDSLLMHRYSSNVIDGFGRCSGAQLLYIDAFHDDLVHRSFEKPLA